MRMTICHIQDSTKLKRDLIDQEKTINADQPYGGIFNEFGFDTKDNENGGRG